MKKERGTFGKKTNGCMKTKSQPGIALKGSLKGYFLIPANFYRLAGWSYQFK